MAFHDLKNKQKSVWSNVFWYGEVCIFWQFIQYTIHRDKTNFKISFGSKYALIFLSRAPTYHSFSFNSRFLYELKNKVCLSRSVRGIFHFQFRFHFIKAYTFAFNKKYRPFDFRTSKFLSNLHTVLLPDLSFLSRDKNLLSSMIFASVETLQKLTWRRIF